MVLRIILRRMTSEWRRSTSAQAKKPSTGRASARQLFVLLGAVVMVGAALCSHRLRVQARR
jgi:hypothetical protein